MKKEPRSQALSLRKPAFNPATLAIGLPTLLMSASIFAQSQSAQDDEPIMLDTLQIEERTVDTNPYAEAGAPYKAKVSGDKRHVKDLADTPQTITVLTQTQILDSGKTDLKEILGQQPGITLGTGENGNAFGDRYVIRGHEARSDVFVDGLRDPGMTIRESFAVEQVELTKGPSSTFAGRGSAGGAVNSITKQASTEYDFNKISAGMGTDDYRRITLDSNLKVSDQVAVRANILHSFEEVPDRDPADRERNGIALSGLFQASDKLRLIADYYHLDGEDNPDLGSYISSTTGPDDDIAVYTQDADFLESEVDTFTFRAEYDFNDDLSLTNATRYGTTDNGYVVTGARGTVRDASDPAGAIDTISLSTHQGWQEVEYVANQTNLYWDKALAGLKHQFIFSLEYTKQDVTNGVYDIVNNGASNCVVSGRGGPSNGYCIIDGNGNTVGNLDNLMQRQISKGDTDSDYSIETTAFSVMDTIDFNESWSLFLGLRADHFDYTNDVGSTDPVEWAYSDTLINGHAGLVYNIHDDANVYLTYSTASEINGGESDLGANCGYGGLCGSVGIVEDSEPENVENIELGTKWNLFDEKLLVSAAIFRITKDDVMESANGYDYDSLGFLNTGEHRVDGVELTLTGNLTDKLSTQFGVTSMNAKILESYTETNEGLTLANFSDNSMNLQLRYELTPEFAFGGSASYYSEKFVGQPDSAANEDLEVPSYTVYDLFASYQISKDLGARLNIGNITDEDYYLTAYRSGAFAYIGDRRNAQLTLTYEF